jgi:hypothetical protein
MTQATAITAVSDHGEFIPKAAGRSHINGEPWPG